MKNRTSELYAIADVVEARLRAAEKACGTYASDPRGFYDRHRAAMAALVDQLAADLADKGGARVTDRWDGARVRIAGIASSSTSGIAGALHNWIVAARRKARAAQ